MPRLMDKTDWMQTVADVDAAEHVWYENIVEDADNVSFPLPERGRYRVILVKLDGVLDSRPISRNTPRGYSQKRKISPRVRALRGAAKFNGNRDYKDVLADALAEKYETLG